VLGFIQSILQSQAKTNSKNLPKPFIVPANIEKEVYRIQVEHVMFPPLETKQTI
jgi:hypothetical protein